MVSKSLRSAFRFFHEHSGYSVPPGRAVCALDLARAEALASEEGWRVEWHDDAEGARDWYCECGCQPSEVLGCVLTFTHDDGSEAHFSLWGIGDPSPEYRRVVEAELASEAREAFYVRLCDNVGSL